jgi:hypothetical protein
MEHSIAKAIRIAGAQICRRLDVLIEAAGKPPVQDIEGTFAPRNPLAPAAARKEQPVTAPASSPAVIPRKRGRPRKNDEVSQEELSDKTAEVSVIIFLLLLFFTILPGVLL